MNSAFKWGIGLLVVGWILALIGLIWLMYLRSLTDQSTAATRAGMAAIILFIGIFLILLGIITVAYGSLGY